jgi:hypothetical protein
MLDLGGNCRGLVAVRYRRDKRGVRRNVHKFLKHVKTVLFAEQQHFCSFTGRPRIFVSLLYVGNIGSSSRTQDSAYL